MPGVLQLSTGAWFEPDDPAAKRTMCIHGNPNILTRDIGTSKLAQGSTGQIARVEFERYAGEPPRVTIFEAITFGTGGEELAVSRRYASKPAGTGSNRR